MQDDDIEILDDSEDPMICQICHVPLSQETPAGRQAHYDEHFNDDLSKNVQPSGSHVIDLSDDTDAPRKPNRLRESKVTPPQSVSDTQNVFWHRSQDRQPPANFTPGLIPLLKQALLKAHAKGNTVRAALCYEGMVHVKTETWDLGWGCGYRNFLMACTALMDQQVQPLYFPALDAPTPPGVRNLQHWVEDAWKAGFDPEGAAELKREVVGTRKWIGTAELYVAFLHRGISSRLVDFPHVESGADALLKWIENYFTSPLPSGMKAMKAKVKTTVDEALRGASPVVVTDRMPLVLQHQGHSRTIVGYEKRKNGTTNLLCFDPSKGPRPQVRNAAISRYLGSRGQSSQPPTPEKHKISPSKLANRILHPKKRNTGTPTSPSPITNKRRQVDDEQTPGRKRVRGGLKPPDKEVIDLDSDDDEFEIIDNSAGSSNHPKASDIAENDYSRVLEFFRLKPRRVGRKDRYQILYFPLEDILTEEERWSRRIVTSEVVN